MSDDEEKEVKSLKTSKVLKGKGGDDQKYESVRNYLDRYNLPRILQEGLLKIEQERPDDPVRALGNYLLEKAGK